MQSTVAGTDNKNDSEFLLEKINQLKIQQN